MDQQSKANASYFKPEMVATEYPIADYELKYQFFNKKYPHFGCASIVHEKLLDRKLQALLSRVELIGE